LSGPARDAAGPDLPQQVLGKTPIRNRASAAMLVT
jgi:hypothetical protein